MSVMALRKRHHVLMAFRASNLTFDHANLRMTASSRTLLLDESSHASSEITISGTEISGAELRRLERRNASPETTKSTVFDLDTALAAGKDHLVSVRGLDLYCDDCSITGQASPFFRYKINTDIRDCVDKIAALAHEDDSTLSGILQGIGQDIETGVDCIGDALAAVEHGLAHDVVDLVKGNPDKELPVLHWIVPEAIVGIEASETIDASLNFEMSAIEGIDLKCSFPGGIGSNCAVSAISALFRPGSSKQPGDLSFTLGTWELGLSFAYGLTVEAKATVDVDVKLPVTAEIGQGQSAELDLMSPAWHNTIHPKLKSGPLSVSATDPELCLSVALGPSIKASLGSKKLAKLSKIEATARLDLPRIQSCFKPAHDVDAQCKPGTIQDAVELDTTAGFGLDVELTTVLTHSGNLAAPLYKSVNLYKHCFNLDSSDPLQGLNGSSSSSGSSKGMNPSIPLPHYPPSYTGSPALNGTNPPSPTGSGISSPSSTGSPGSGGNYTSSYNCAGVGPSPGGQPCAYMGGGPVTCESLYTWSCPNGDSGAVPADTICACGAFRHPGWQPPAVAKPACTSGIYCYDEQTFGVCGPAGIESPQLVAPGTMCIGGAITYAY